MKKTLAASLIIITAVLFAGVGSYAHATWLSFDSDVTVSENNVDEIMDILRQVNTDKLTAEEALSELEALNPAGLAKLNKELREEIKELNKYIAHLETELTKANNAVDELNVKTDSAVDEARGFVE